jgi:hypothetical protein
MLIYVLSNFLYFFLSIFLFFFFLSLFLPFGEVRRGFFLYPSPLGRLGGANPSGRLGGANPLGR